MYVLESPVELAVGMLDLVLHLDCFCALFAGTFCNMQAVAMVQSALVLQIT
jgi:hypothetical protein